MKIAIDELTTKVIASLQAAGFGDEEAAKTADYLVWAEMSGISTQGIVKLTGAVAFQNIKPTGNIVVDRDTKLSRLLNANNHLSPYASQVAAEVAANKAREHGFGIVGVRNSQSSNGAQAFYVEQIAAKGFIGIAAARAINSTAGFGGIDPVFSTNPIGFAFPTTGDPLIVDMATSAMTKFGLLLAQARGETIPEHMAVDKNGEPTTDATAALEGALLSFDHGYKGSALAMVVEIIAGPLVGATSFIDPAGEWGTVFVAIDPELLVDADKFKADCSALAKKLKAARPGKGVDEIRLPGERAAKSRKKCEQTGIVEVEDALLKQLGYVS